MQRAAERNSLGRQHMMRKISSLTDLPVEIIERIVAKCQENDVEALVDDHKTIVKRDDPAHPTDKDAIEEAGWETEDDDEEIDEDMDDSLGIDDEFGDDIIASGFCELCETYHRIGKRFCLDHTNLPVDVPHPPSLHQLAMTSRFLRKLALPYIHQSVDFEALDNQKLERYLELIVPKYGHLVKDFWIRISAGENAEFFHIGEEEAEDPSLYLPERRFDLTMQLMRALPNLVSVDVDYTYLESRRMDDLFDNIQERGEMLLGLHLAADVMRCRLTSRQLCPLLGALKNLESLEISGIDQQSSSEPMLRDTIAGLPNLAILDLADAHCVQDDWAEANWSSKLRALDLDDCQNISGAGVEALILRHASSLRHLSLNGTPYQSIGNFNTGKPFDLPNLMTLSLEDYQFDFNLIKRFEHCASLARLELGTLDEMDPQQLIEVIERGGFPALKEIMLTCDWPTAAEHRAMDTLELICFEKGIALEIEAPDSDDEDDDDDMSFDDDDPENEYWEEGFTEDEDTDGLTDDEDHDGSTDLSDTEF